VGMAFVIVMIVCLFCGLFCLTEEFFELLITTFYVDRMAVIFRCSRGGAMRKMHGSRGRTDR